MATVTTPPFEEKRKASRNIGVFTLYGPAQLPGTGYNLRQAFTLLLERDEGGSFVVSEPTTGAFHYADDLPEAVAGFIRTFVEEFEMLDARASSLSPAMATNLERFRMLIEASPK
jgi:hypothetical protein